MRDVHEPDRTAQLIITRGRAPIGAEARAIGLPEKAWAAWNFSPRG
jgi:hypothetical protein